MVAEVRGECPDLREVLFLGDPEWEQLLATGRAADRGAAGAAGGRAVGRRPDQHPVHVGDDGLPEGRDAHPPQPAQQRVLRRRGLRLHRGRPDLHPGALLPLLRHGHGQPGGHHARRDDGDPGARLRPGADAAGRAGGALHLAVRRPDDVHRRAGAARLRRLRPRPRLRTGIMAGSPCPVEVMKRVVAEMGMAEVTICYGMTETSPVSTQTGADDDLDRRTSTVGRVHPHLEVKVVDPATGLTVPARRAGRVLHPRLLGDARLLGRAGEDRRGDRRAPAGCTPATSR